MGESGLYTARMRVVEAMERGIPWHETAKLAGIQISQSTAYRLRQRMRQGGEQALLEGRQGHPAKLRGEVRQWLEEICRQAPHTPSSEVQAQLPRFRPNKPLFDASPRRLRGDCCSAVGESHSRHRAPWVSPSQANTLYPFVRQLYEPWNGPDFSDQAHDVVLAKRGACVACHCRAQNSWLDETLS